MTIEQLARPEIVAMKPYSSARKEAPGQGVLLNANEAPWPLLETDSGLNRYPDPQPERLRRRLARLYGAAEENLLITRGSDEGIDLLTRVFCRAGEDAILQCPPAFGMYRIAAQTQGAAVVSVERGGEEFALDEAGDPASTVAKAMPFTPSVCVAFVAVSRFEPPRSGGPTACPAGRGHRRSSGTRWTMGEGTRGGVQEIGRASCRERV